MRQGFERVLRETADTAEKRSIRRQWECALLLAGALAAASFAPHPIVLPIVSAILIFAAALAGSYAWLRSEPRSPGEFTRWDQSGVLIFAGFVAALTGDSGEVIQFMESFAEVPVARQ
jgi:hypothetical protein